MIITGFYWVFLYFYRIRTEFLHGFPLLPSLLRFSMNITEFLPSFFWGALLVSGMSLRVGHDEEPSLLMPLVDSSVPSGSSLCVCVCVCGFLFGKFRWAPQLLLVFGAASASFGSLGFCVLSRPSPISWLDVPSFTGFYWVTEFFFPPSFIDRFLAFPGLY